MLWRDAVDGITARWEMWNNTGMDISADEAVAIVDAVERLNEVKGSHGDRLRFFNAIKIKR